MVTDGAVIRLGGLSELDVHELSLELGDLVPVREVEDLEADRAGEPFTIALSFALGAVAVKAIALWLMKSRTTTEVELKYERGEPGGVFERRSAKLSFSSSDPPTAEVIDWLGAELNMDTETIGLANKLAGI